MMKNPTPSEPAMGSGPAKSPKLSRLSRDNSYETGMTLIVPSLLVQELDKILT
jgi:hypothetical protein